MAAARPVAVPPVSAPSRSSYNKDRISQPALRGSTGIKMRLFPHLGKLAFLDGSECVSIPSRTLSCSEEYRGGRGKGAHEKKA